MFLSLVANIFIVSTSLAQRPTHVPKQGNRLHIFESPETFIFYVVIPLAIIVLYVVWLKKRNQNSK